MNEAILQVDRITLTLDKRTILNQLSIAFWKGHVHALVGPNGAGKSTLASVIMGLSGYREYEGDLVYEGQSLKNVPLDERARRGITLAWQEPARFEGLRVEAFIRAAARDRGDARIREVLEQVGLKAEDYLNRAVDHTLSGGERKRIELASILAMEPRLVLMDEPDSGIDVGALDRIFDTLQTLKKKNATVILITHSPVVLRHAEHAFLMCHGQLIDKGSVDKIGKYFTGKCLPCDHINQPALNGEVSP